MTGSIGECMTHTTGSMLQQLETETALNLIRTYTRGSSQAEPRRYLTASHAIQPPILICSAHLTPAINVLHLQTLSGQVPKGRDGRVMYILHTTRRALVGSRLANLSILAVCAGETTPPNNAPLRAIRLNH